MFIQVVVIETSNGRLEDVSGGRRPRRDTPAPVLEVQGGLCLGSSQTELSGEVLAEPCRRVQPQVSEALRNLILGQPRYRAGSLENAVHLVRGRELDGPCAVLPDWR